MTLFRAAAAVGAATLLAGGVLGGVTLVGAHAASADPSSGKTAADTTAGTAPATTTAGNAATTAGDATTKAGDTPAGATGGANGEKALARSCAQVPAQLARAQKAQTLLGADAGTAGSLAALRARIAKANAAGRTDLARLLSDRLAIRQDLAGILPDRVAKLQDAQQVCAAHPLPPAHS